MDRAEILRWLREEDEKRLGHLWQLADETRARYVGHAVYLRGLIEFSNYCARLCHYCGIRADHRDIHRYRMTADEVVASAREAADLGYGTVVLQSGEDFGITREWMRDLIRRIKNEVGVAITLSLGERSTEDLKTWRQAGADRYLLRFETSNHELYNRIHPPITGGKSERFGILENLRTLGYEVGSGILIGIPGQSYDDLTRDIEKLVELDLDMIGCGPFIAHPDTPLGKDQKRWRLPDGVQVPNTEIMTYKVVALARLVRPNANIPSTTALATLNKTNGRELGLMRGANILMPNVTPDQYRVCYEIYPSKACLRDSRAPGANTIRSRLDAIGRTIGTGRGDSINYATRAGAPARQSR